MATLSLDSRSPSGVPSRPLAGQTPGKTLSELFRFGLWGAVSAGGFTVDMIVCLQHGEVSALPGLLLLAIMTTIAFCVRAPSGAEDAAQGSDGGAERASGRREFSRRRHGLVQ